MHKSYGQKKKLLMSLLILLLLLVLAVATSIFETKANAVDLDKALQAANELHELGLFNGTGTNLDGTPIYNLEQDATRNQAIIMLVRLLGKEKVATSNIWYIPFTDVQPFSTSYYSIGYAYNHGLTNGTSDTTYGGTKTIKSNQYITFVLRSLGYKSPEDFKVSKSYEFADSIGLTHGEYSDTSKKFTRGDVAIISYAALDVEMAGGGTIREQIEKNKDMNSEELYRQIDIVQYASYGEALKYMTKAPNGTNYSIITEIGMDKGTIAAYSFIGLEKENYGVAVIYKDGRVVRLPLPEWQSNIRYEPMVLHYDENYDYVFYEAGVYGYMYSMSEMTTSVNKLVEEK